jgi:hypothetical protein
MVSQDSSNIDTYNNLNSFNINQSKQQSLSHAIKLSESNNQIYTDEILLSSSHNTHNMSHINTNGINHTSSINKFKNYKTII